MKVSQRQIIEVPFNLAQGVENHPAIVLSCNDAIEEEEAFVAVMLTSTLRNDEFSFEIIESMLTKSLEKKVEVRIHLISYFSIRDVIENSHTSSYVKEFAYNSLLEAINDNVLSIT